MKTNGVHCQVSPMITATRAAHGSVTHDQGADHDERREGEQQRQGVGEGVGGEGAVGDRQGRERHHTGRPHTSKAQAAQVQRLTRRLLGFVPSPAS